MSQRWPGNQGERERDDPLSGEVKKEASQVDGMEQMDETCVCSGL